MAAQTRAISVTFNDNDGKATWRVYPEGCHHIARHQRIFGKYRTRWILFKRFWAALKRAESMANENYMTGNKLWVFKAEIPE